MNKKPNIAPMLLYFMFTILFSTFCLYFQMSLFYGIVLEENKTNISTEIENTTENIVEEDIEETITHNTLVEIERTTSYKIYVDTETRNMYLKNNSYSTKQNDFVLMYDGTTPKIYTGEINGETYEEFLQK